MIYTDRYIEFEEELWNKFELLVREGAKFPSLVDVTYPKGINPQGLIKDTDGRSSFLAKELVQDSNYKLKADINENDIIVDFNKVKFIDSNNNVHQIEPDVIDLYWICQILDSAK